MSGLVGGGSSVDIPKQEAENVKRTAAPVEQLSEQARKNRRLSASLLTRGFTPPTLGQAGLLGV